MAIVRRKPTGKPPWTHGLIAGSPKSGKSRAIAEASTLPYLGQTFWITFGERYADEYGQIPGANYEIVACDDRQDLRAAVRELVREKWVAPDRPNLIAVDSVTAYWELLAAEGQDKANQRALAKLQRAKKADEFDPAREYDVTMDLWNEIRDRWYEVINPLLAYEGPVILTARLDEVTIMDSRGQPTRDKEWKVAAHKRLTGDVGAILEFRGAYPHQRRVITGVTSYAMDLEVDAEVRKPITYGFAELLADMKVTPETVGVAMAGATTPTPEGRLPDNWEQRFTAAVEFDNQAAAKELWALAGNPEKARMTEIIEEAKRAKVATAARVGEETAEVADPAPTPEPEADPYDADDAAAMEAEVKAAIAPTMPESPEPPADATADERLEWAKTYDWDSAAKQARAGARKRLNTAKEKGDIKALEAVIRQCRSQHWYDLLRDAEGARKWALDVAGQKELVEQKRVV